MTMGLPHPIIVQFSYSSERLAFILLQSLSLEDGRCKTLWNHSSTIYTQLDGMVNAKPWKPSVSQMENLRSLPTLILFPGFPQTLRKL
jgi:hypothetical protein